MVLKMLVCGIMFLSVGFVENVGDTLYLISNIVNVK